MKEIANLRPKMCSYLTDDDIIDKKPKSTKKCNQRRNKMRKLQKMSGK